MNIKRLVIENFKSIERIELVEPNPFTVFVGPNGSGKSNIFEALEFVNVEFKYSAARSLFGGPEKFLSRQRKHGIFLVEINLEEFTYWMRHSQEKIFLSDSNYSGFQPDTFIIKRSELTMDNLESQSFQQLLKNFTRLFIGKDELIKLRFNDTQRLSISASNLEPVLKRILQNPILRSEIFEWLELFVPGFKAVEVDDRDELHWFEDHGADYFTKDLISDGTYNILALLTAVYQSEEPQFLCIEEVENGLHPEVILSLIDFFRKQCEEKGHYIWLNTHSETVVKLLTTDEIVLVNKRKGATVTKQVKGMNTSDNR